ncbi:hypothetical protein Hanom_Chr12g01165511 [Helianthus anomalus]
MHKPRQPPVAMVWPGFRSGKKPSQPCKTFRSETLEHNKTPHSIVVLSGSET